MNFLVSLLLKIVTSKVAEQAIGYGVNKLLEHKSDGIGKDLARTMINGVAQSKLNPTKESMFEEALEALK